MKEENKTSENWGGKRKGSGRKKLTESGRKNFALSLQQKQIDFIKETAERFNMKYSWFVLDAVYYYAANHLPSISKEGTTPKLIEVDGMVEVQENVNTDTFTTLFLEWIESKGWYYGGSIRELDEK